MYIIVNVHKPCKLQVILLRSKQDINSIDRFSKNTSISNFMKNRPFGGELFREDGQTDKMKHLVALLTFSNKLNKQLDSCSCHEDK